jgi:exo-beta-1,3-glucanase (GH17 family)
VVLLDPLSLVVKRPGLLRCRIAALLLFVFLLTLGGHLVVAQVQAPVYGLDFGPYKTGQSPGSQITTTQITQMLTTIAPYTQWVRTYSSVNGVEQVCRIAHTLGLKCAAGASIIGASGTTPSGCPVNPPTDQQEICGLITQMQAGYVDLAIVGTEAMYNNYVSAATLTTEINQVKAAAPGIKVTTADTYAELIDNFSAYPQLLSAVDVVLVNIYPVYEGISLADSASWLNSWYQILCSSVGSKEIQISETGWASAGSISGDATAAPVNSAVYLLNVVSWARANNIKYFLFEAYDEPWKSSEDSFGPHWGLWDSNGNLKPGMQAIFDGETISNNWGGNTVSGGSGSSPQVSITYVPAYGWTNAMTGQVFNVAPASYKIACYIYVSPTWYVKPYATRTLTPIFQDGTWSCLPASTGDVRETMLGAFLLPNGSSPPEQTGGVPPLVLTQSATAYATVSRSQYAIRGAVTDSGGLAMSNVSVTLSSSNAPLTTVTGSNGTYSFPNLSANGSYSVAASASGATFVSGSQSGLSSLSGVVTVNFTATSRLLVISSQLADAYGSALSGVGIQLSGTSSGSYVTDAFGNFSTSGLTPGGSYTITPSLSGYTFSPASQTFSNLSSDQTATFTVNATLSQTISFGALTNQPTGTAPFSLSASATSGLPVGFTASTTSVCTVLGTVLTLVGPGSCSVTAIQPGGRAYQPAPSITQTFVVGPQTITFGSLITRTYGDGPLTLTATASSGLTVSFASTTNPVCTVSGTTLTIVAAGTCSITATQAGNSTYNAASPVSQSFTVGKASLTVAANNLSMVDNTTMPVLTATITGLVNNDTVTGSTNAFPVVNNGDTLSGAVTGVLRLATTANSTSTPQGYSITQGLAGLGLSAANYTISFVPATLTVTVARPALSAIALNFGAQAVNVASASQTVTVTNVDSNALSVTSVNPSGDFSLTNNCGTVGSGANCTITVQFTPTTSGPRSGAIAIVDNASNSPQTIRLFGVGTPVPGPGVSLSAIDLNFGVQAVNTTSAPQTVTLTNSGAAVLTVGGITASTGFGQTNNCSSVAVSAVCLINVTFTPTAPGVRSGTVTIVNNASGSPHIIRLTGAGTTTAPQVGLSTVRLTFGTQTVGTSSSAETVTVTNAGATTLTITGVAVTGDFSASGCVGSLSAGVSCTLSVTFKPTATGVRNGTVALTDNATGSPHTIRLFGNGT